MLYFSLVFLYLYYCNLVWASTYQSNLLSYHFTSKTCCQNLGRCSFDAHTDPLFKELRIPTFDHCKWDSLCFPTNLGCCIQILTVFFILKKDVHTYSTRNAKFLHLPLCRTNICQFSVRYQGPNFFNSLGDKTVSSISFQSFTIRLKRFFYLNHGCQC